MDYTISHNYPAPARGNSIHDRDSGYPAQIRFASYCEHYLATWCGSCFVARFGLVCLSVATLLTATRLCSQRKQSVNIGEQHCMCPSAVCSPLAMLLPSFRSAQLLVLHLQLALCCPGPICWHSWQICRRRQRLSFPAQSVGRHWNFLDRRPCFSYLYHWRRACTCRSSTRTYPSSRGQSPQPRWWSIQ